MKEINIFDTKSIILLLIGSELSEIRRVSRYFTKNNYLNGLRFVQHEANKLRQHNTNIHQT